MTISVRRVAAVSSYRRGRGTLQQQFVFVGTDPDAVARVLHEEPLVGDGSVFGDRPGREQPRSGPSRLVTDFSPAPGFRFDVELTPHDEGFVVRFTQPDRTVPYLQGELLWIIDAHGEGAVLDEQINTDRALAVVAEPLGGSRPSVRRRLFFAVGHKQVTSGATRNLAAIIDQRPS